MDHPVRRSAANALRTDYLIQSGSDLVKLVIGTIRLMRPVRDYPKVSLPRHDRPRATLALGIVVREVRIDAAKVLMSGLIDRRRSFCGASGGQEGRRKHE